MFPCEFEECQKVCTSERSLRRHFETFPFHKVNTIKVQNARSATEEYINDCPSVNRVARLKELAKNIQSQELLSIFLSRIVKELTTYQFMLSACQDEENVNLTKLCKKFTEVIQRF